MWAVLTAAPLLKHYLVVSGVATGLVASLLAAVLALLIAGDPSNTSCVLSELYWLRRITCSSIAKLLTIA